MEAAAVARIARARNIPFAAIKAISDEFDFELPGLERFSTPTGQFRERAFAAHAALRPWLWLRVAKMARSSSLAARNLCTAIAAEIDLKKNLPHTVAAKAYDTR